MQKNPLARFVREPRCFLEYTGLVLSIFLWASTANAISITGVQVQPSGSISQLEEVELIVQISTGHSPAFLYRSTEVEVRRDEIIVRVYPDEGLLTVPDSLSERVTVGELSPGDYRLLVLLEVELPNYGSRTFAVEEFTVEPVLKAAVDTDRTLVLWWDDPREQFALEWTSDLALSQWQLSTEAPEFISGRRWVRIPNPPGQTFFRLARR